MPPKIKIFLWQVLHDKIQSGEQLAKRNWPGSKFCVLCGKLEDTEHIMLSHGCFCLG